MAKQETNTVPEIIDSVEALTAKMKAMRKAQREFASFTQEQVDKIFYERQRLLTSRGFLWPKWLLQRQAWEW